jgi:hypothetical protein
MARALDGYSLELVFDDGVRGTADPADLDADDVCEQRLRAYLLPDSLVVDDFGLQSLNSAESEELRQLACDR